MPDVALSVISNGDDADATPVNNNFQALQAALNALDADNWASGKIFAANKITQGGASTNQALIWNGTDWAPAAFNPTALSQGGAGTGQALVWNGSAWAPTTVASLLGSVQYNPTTVTTASTSSTTGADIDATNLSLTVTVPSSGKILAQFNFFVTTTNANISFFGLRESTTDIAYAKLGGTGVVSTERHMVNLLVTGLSAGSHTYKAAFKSTSGTTSVSYGTQASPASTDTGPFVMTIWSVP